MLLELLADIGILAGGFAGGIILPRLAKKQSPEKTPFDGAYDWFYSRGSRAFCCPKCYDNTNKSQPPHCECETYHQEHFHFQCNACKVKLIMKTADNSKRK